MIVCRLCLLFVLCLASALSSAATQRALLIGISNYEANLTPLAGAKNDVLLIQELLIQKYGFDQSNIQVMIDEQATRAQIFAAIRALSDRSAPDDIVLIHYSGHGSQSPDTNGDEPDGFDETILPHDARTPGIADITDDELNTLIAAFRSESVVVILDSCHSGTGTRSGPSRVSQRWVAADTREELYESISTRQVLNLPISENHVFFAAAQDSESELDGPFGPNKMRLGLFTAALVGVLVNSPPNITPMQAITGVNVRVEALKASAAGMPIPEPNMEAPLDKQQRPMFVFENSVAPQAPAQAPVQFTSGDQPQFAATKSIHVTMNGMSQPALAQRIAGDIGGDIRIASSIEDADSVVDVVGQDTFDVYGPSGVVQVASGLSRSRADALGTAGASSKEFEFLKKVLLNAPTLADLISLDNPRLDLQIKLRAAGVPDVRTQSRSERTVKVSVNTRNHQLQYYETGAIRTRANSLQLEVRGSRDCYLTVASLNSMGDVFMLLPNSGQELSGFLSQGRITSNTNILIPDSFADDNLAGFHFDYSPPGGVDRIIAVCFSRLPDAERFRAQIAKLELGGTLDAALFNMDTRGATNVRPSLATGQAPPNQSQPSQMPPSQPPPGQVSSTPYQAIPAQPGSGQAPAVAAWAVAKISLNVGPD